MNRTIITTDEEFLRWFNNVEGSVISLDTETTSLDYLRMELLGISLCDGKQSCYVKFNDVITKGLVLDYLDAWLPFFTVVMHNAPFDLKVLYKNNVHLDKIFCTLVGAKLVDENRSKKQGYGLKSLSRDWLGVKKIVKYDAVSHNPDSEEFANYAIDDAVNTYNLYLYEYSILKRENLLYLMEEIEMPFQFVLRDMEINGVKVNLDKLEKFRDDCNTILNHLECSMLSIYNLAHRTERDLFGNVTHISPINFGSTKHLVSAIKKLGFEVDVFTKKGNPSVGKVYLQQMKGKHPFFDLLWRYRKLQKLNSGFIQPAYDFIGLDGKIRPSYNMVRTGRLSCFNPNLQQLPNPKKEKLEFNYREIFIPSEGCKFVKADYSGQELRNLAECSKDGNMVDAFKNNYDLHLVTANRIFNLNLDNNSLVSDSESNVEVCKKYKAERHQAKNGVNFPTVYGATAQRIAQDNNVSIEEAQRWLDEFDTLYPEVKKWKLKVNTRVQKLGYTTTLMGRHRRFPNYKKENRWGKAKIERQAANFEIQGFSADQMKIAAALVHQYQDKYRARNVMSVHDELVWEVPDEYCEEFAKRIKCTMETCVSLSIPILVEVKIVESYGK